MKKYTRQDIIRMRESGELTKEEARLELEALLKAGPQQAKPKAEPVDPMVALASELRSMADRLEQAIGTQNAALMEVAQSLLKTGKTLRVEFPKDNGRPKKLVATPTRDHRGLAEKWTVEVIS